MASLRERIDQSLTAELLLACLGWSWAILVTFEERLAGLLSPTAAAAWSVFWTRQWLAKLRGAAVARAALRLDEQDTKPLNVR